MISCTSLSDTVLLDGAAHFWMVSAMPRAKPDEEQHQIGLRLGVSLLRRADAYSARLSAEHPGMRFTRTDAIRMILTLHLAPDPEAPALPDAAPDAAPTKPSRPSAKATAKPRAKRAKRRA